jgi:hypothetical protein
MGFNNITGGYYTTSINSGYYSTGTITISRGTGLINAVTTSGTTLITK